MHPAAIADGESVERDALFGHHPAAAALPGGLVVAAFEYPRVHAQQPIGLNGAALARIHLRGLDDLAGHQPRRRLFVLTRAREHHNFAVAGGIELLALVALGDIAQQPGQQRLVNRS